MDEVWERVTGGLSGAAVFRGRGVYRKGHASLRSDTRNPQYGSDFADRYLARCGHDAVDYDKFDFYRLLDEFL
jgi:aminoglycoside phosphotransferase